MRILLAGPEYFNYSTSVAQALASLGHTVTQSNLAVYPALAGNIMKKFDRFFRRNDAFEWNKQRWNKDIILKWHQTQPDVCFILNDLMFSPDTLKLFKAKGTKIIYWAIDNIRFSDNALSNAHLYDKIFSLDLSDVDFMNSTGLTCGYCPVGYDNSIYKTAELHKDIDICFAGALTHNRRALLRILSSYCLETNRKMEIWSRCWRKGHLLKQASFVLRHSPINKFLVNSSIEPYQLSNLYSRSKICLNIHSTNHSGINPRTFEILGTKSFQLVDERSQLAALCFPEHHIITYRSTQDLLDKTDYYLNHNEEREQIAENGYNFVSSHYTMRHCIAKIMDESGLSGI